MSAVQQPTPTLRDHREPAVICRERGWTAGTRLVGDEGFGPTVIEITAIGERSILAKTISHDGKPLAFCHNETSWTLSCRDWRKVMVDQETTPSTGLTFAEIGDLARRLANGLPAELPALCEIEAAGLVGALKACWLGLVAPEVSSQQVTDALRILRLSPTATLPSQADPGSVGYDLHADLPDRGEMWIYADGMALIPTGIAAAPPPGTYIRIAPRSGHAARYGLDILAGVIDPGYRGPLQVVVVKHGDKPMLVKHGDRIAQLIIERCATPDVVEVASLEETERGAGGFGSTGC